MFSPPPPTSPVDEDTERGRARAIGTVSVVAPWRSVPGLPTLVRGLERRRDRRPTGGRIPPRVPRMAGRGRHLAQPDDAVAERRLGLRRRGLLRRPSRP